MSLSRGNWSALSRLSKQRSEDDEEEQIRERRRRNRISSNPGEKVIEVLSEEGDSDKSLLSSVSAHSTEETEKKEQTEKHQSFKTLELGTVSEIGVNRELRSDEEKSKCYAAQNSQISRSENGVNNSNIQNDFQNHKLQRDQNLEDKKQTKEINKLTAGDNSEECNSQQKFQGSNNQTKVSLASGSQKEVSQGAKQQNKLIVNFKKSNHKINETQESENWVQREEKKANDTKQLIGQDIPDSSPSSSSISSIHRDVVTDIYSSSESVPVNDYGASSSTKRTETHRSQVFVSTVKIPRKQSTSDKDDRHISETDLPVQNKTGNEAPSATKTIKRTEMHIAALPSRSNSNKEVRLCFETHM
ncbi:hypothetical protein XELAEV_18014805mg [Xenopus laevis]|uniref:Uncharacterized protein n=1 Tax=Xenopus laevis TaxID=8355 RepID=A0A974HVB4_XENLA|nr:hypothetical protein XELAEV_18014805mg [Xenopus laevis]